MSRPPIGIALVMCADTPITELRVQGLFDAAASTLKRADVIRDINSGSHFNTLYKESAGHYQIGPLLHVYEKDGRSYIRTDRNKIEEDNLGELHSMDNCPF